MEDYKEDRAQSYREIRQNIQNLQGKLRASRDTLQKRKIIDEISRLEHERLREGNLFADEGFVVEDEEVSGDEFPILGRIWERYEKVLAENREQTRDVQGLILYLRYFDEEFLGFLTPRKLKLDVKYSMVRDTFYNLYNQLERNLLNYQEESKRIGAGDYTKKYEDDILKRLVEMRNALFIESDRFFRRLRQFAEDLLDDLEEKQILCQNGDDFLSYSNIDRETALRGLSVKEAIGKVYELADESVDFLDVPDFQR
ncbi:MAG TPA: hypothetical protein VMW87_13485 [Spirochaetia bacterium]|nr:hypothetical protein [Spirochaetia bacterium]